MANRGLPITSSGAAIADTDALTEGAANLYYTDARVDANTTVTGNTAAAAAAAAAATAANALAVTKITEAEGDARYVEVAGDTMTGPLTVNNTAGGNSSMTLTHAVANYYWFSDTGEATARVHSFAQYNRALRIESRDAAFGQTTSLFYVGHPQDPAGSRGGVSVGDVTVATDQGIGTLNVSADLYEQNVKLSDKYVEVSGDTMTGNLNIFPAAGTSQLQLSGTQSRLRCIDNDYGVAADAGLEYLTANGESGRRVISGAGAVARNVDVIRHSDAAMTLGAATGGFMGDSALNTKAYFVDGQQIGMRPVPTSILISSVGNRAATNVNLTGAPPNATGVLVRAVATGTGAQSGKVQLGQGRRTLNQPENWPVLFIKNAGATTIPYTVTDATAGFEVDVELLGYYL